MNINEVSASSRFEVTKLGTEIVDGHSSPSLTFYKCPVCAERIRFSRANFEEKGRRETSNLVFELAKSISEMAKKRGYLHFEYLDWYCPKCRLASRAYFQQNAGGKHGDSYIEIFSVFEVECT